MNWPIKITILIQNFRHVHYFVQFKKMCFSKNKLQPKQILFTPFFKIDNVPETVWQGLYPDPNTIWIRNTGRWLASMFNLGVVLVEVEVEVEVAHPLIQHKFSYFGQKCREISMKPWFRSGQMSIISGEGSGVNSRIWIRIKVQYVDPQSWINLKLNGGRWGQQGPRKI